MAGPNANVNGCTPLPLAQNKRPTTPWSTDACRLPVQLSCRLPDFLCRFMFTSHDTEGRAAEADTRWHDRRHRITPASGPRAGRGFSNCMSATSIPLFKQLIGLKEKLNRYFFIPQFYNSTYTCTCIL